MATTRRFAALALIGVASACAQAQDPTPAASQATRWSCWYNDNDERPAIACRLDAVPVRVEALPQGSDAWMDRLPPVVRQIRENPGALAEQMILIPLHAPPLDMPMTARLARNVMCGARPGCEVDFSLRPRRGG